MNRTDLEAAWSVLSAAAPAPGDLRLAPIDVSNDVGRLYAGIDASRRLHLLIPVEPGRPVRADRRSRGVIIELSEYELDSALRPFIDVSCQDPGLTDVFQRLTWEMVEHIQERPGQSERACQQVLARWRDLLERRRSPLGPDAAAGLFGELHILAALIEACPSCPLDVWTGPSGRRHDFTSPDSAIEVKTTRRSEGRFVEIHGVEQLLPSPGGELFLAFLRVEPRTDGMTIAESVERIKELGVDPTHLEQLLSQAGWSLGTDEDERLVVTEQLLFAVDDEFPRVVPSSFLHGELPPGVLRLRYQVDLSGPAPTPLSSGQAAKALLRVASTA